MIFFTYCITYNYFTLYLQLDGMILANTFEEPFGNVCGKGVWSELSEDVASNICENIVALASFNGDFTVLCCLLFHICTLIITN